MIARLLRAAQLKFKGAGVQTGNMVAVQIAEGLALLTEAMIKGAEATEGGVRPKAGSCAVYEGDVLESVYAFNVGRATCGDMFKWARGKKVRVTVEVIP